MNSVIYREKSRFNRQPVFLPKMTLLLLFSVVMTMFFDSVQGAYPSNMTTKIQVSSRSNAASFVRDEALYMYGGEGRGGNTATDDFVSITFNFSSPYGELIFNRIPMANPESAPKVAGARMVLLPDNNTVLLFGGFAPEHANITAMHLLCYQYTFDDQMWAPIPVNVTPSEISEGAPVLPTHREDHTATLATDGLVYIYGGVVSKENPTIVGDFWSYNPSDKLFTRRELFSLDPLVLFAHVGIALADGNILYTTGAIAYSGNNSIEAELLGPNEGLFYNTVNGEWSYNGEFGGDLAAASARGYSTAVLGREQRYIYFYGGTNMAGQKGLYRHTLSILDTKTWNYTVPTAEHIHGIRPSRRAMACAGIITSNYMVLAQGSARRYFGGIDVAKLPPQIMEDSNNDLGPGPVEITWVANVVTGETENGVLDISSNSISPGIIAAILIIVLLVLIIITFLVWFFRCQVWSVVLSLYNKIIWNPRPGEPHWAEVTRLITKTILTFLLVAFFVFVVIQVLQSPIATVTITEVADGINVDMPEIRFCFDGYDQVVNPLAGNNYLEVNCITSSSDNCDGNIFPLNMLNQEPLFSSSLGEVACYLFIPYNIKLGQNTDELERTNNGSEVHFSFNTEATEQKGILHISFYPPGRNPNRELFFDESNALTYYQKQDMTEEELGNWAAADFNNMATENVLNMNTNDEAFVHYQIQQHQYLRDVGWNYIGFSPILDSKYKVDVTSRKQPMNLEQYSPSNGLLNELTVAPASFNNVRIREQRIYTLINALGSIGGLVSLFIVFLALIFGHRPKSPWGVIHSWSIGGMKRSLSRELTSRFDVLDTPVPFVNIVNRRFASTVDLKHYGPHNMKNLHQMNTTKSVGAESSSDNIMLTDIPENLSDGKHFSQLEERIQLLELVLKSYYIDDEVFRRLDHALKQPDSAIHSNENTNHNSLLHIFRRNGADLRNRKKNSTATQQEDGVHWFDTNMYNNSVISSPPEIPHLSSFLPPSHSYT
ncbi:hypothetical protein BDA99DRAFT_584036 [Phascolomyces articulosus]|uniref:Galactose oxidase n=1 Tax=Phascolomyces articulosus TaxID=60185 RepID=A0AAD5KN06_9FUNG|nr:hypothetical protein BDA99DRAFT_584036 [Phascolomyces articulosus]